MAYRSATCAFCVAACEATCPRCGAHVCEAHGLAARRWCETCEVERRDALELALLEASLRSSGVEDDPDGLRLASNVVALVYHFASLPHRRWQAKRRARIAFETQSPSAIALARSRARRE